MQLIICLRSLGLLFYMFVYYGENFIELTRLLTHFWWQPFILSILEFLTETRSLVNVY
jgi:hypothetical protein